MQKSGKLYHKMQSKSIQCPADSDEEQAKEDGPAAYNDEEAPLPTSVKPEEETKENPMVSSEQSTAQSMDHGHRICSLDIFRDTDLPEMQEAPLLSCESEVADKGFWTNLKDTVHQFVKELMAPPTISAVCFYISLHNGR
jgi:hypothetical protein